MPVPFSAVLMQTRLFNGISEPDVRAMLSCLDAQVRHFKKDDTVLHQGDSLSHIMLLTEGKLLIQHGDFWGNRHILQVIESGDMFGEAYVSPVSEPMLNDVIAAENSTLYLFDARRIMTTCSMACPFHAMVVQNLFFAMSDKNRRLVQKLEHMSKRSTREKLMSYLSEESRRQKRDTFTIPFNRQQLADYLAVDRSAMSSELSKMQREGLIAFEKSRFTLLHVPQNAH